MKTPNETDREEALAEYYLIHEGQKVAVDRETYLANLAEMVRQRVGEKMGENQKSTLQVKQGK